MNLYYLYLGVFAIHVDDRISIHFGNVTAVRRRAPSLGRRGEADLVVDNQMYGATDRIVR